MPPIPITKWTDDDLIIAGMAETQQLHARHEQVVIGASPLEVLETIRCIQEGLRCTEWRGDSCAVRAVVDRWARIFSTYPALSERIRRGWEK